MNWPVRKSTTDLLVVDSLHDALVRPQALAQAATRAAPMPSLATIRDRLLAWETKYRLAQAPATLKAVRADWQVFLDWCDRNRVWALPIASTDLLRFLTDQVVLDKKRSTINRYVNTIRLIHEAAGLPAPTDYREWKLDWRGIVRRLEAAGANAPRQAEALRTEHVAQILDMLGESLLDVRDAALISLASDTLCRESELAALRLEDFRPSNHAWTVDLRRSKTDQEGLGSSRYCSPATKARVDAWCAAASITGGYLFLPVGNRRTLKGETPPKAIAPAEIARIIRRRAVQAGIDVGHRMSGHSGRVGSAIELIENGAALTAIQFAGGWKSQRMVQHYGKRALAGQNAMADLRATQEQKESKGRS